MPWNQEQFVSILPNEFVTKFQMVETTVEIKLESFVLKLDYIFTDEFLPRVFSPLFVHCWHFFVKQRKDINLE